jgi:hypothetical protein
VFWIEWPEFMLDGDGETDAFLRWRAERLSVVRKLREHPALFGWVLGNEVPSWIVTDEGADRVEARLHGLYDAVVAIDPDHFVTHANWPNARALDLGFLDVCSFNVYALWPPEVVARGYGKFIADVLRPIADGRPLLITEYGTNSLEAGEEGQARLTRQCWEQLRAAGAVGGFAFEFADEWWKNYSNPKLEGAWWDRTEVLDDHLEHDRDPEEHYGLVTGDRRPKPAYAAVAAMYGAPASPAPRLASIAVAAVIVLAAISLIWSVWWTGRRRRTRPLSPEPP